MKIDDSTNISSTYSSHKLRHFTTNEWTIVCNIEHEYESRKLTKIFKVFVVVVHQTRENTKTRHPDSAQIVFRRIDLIRRIAEIC